MVRASVMTLTVVSAALAIAGCAPMQSQFAAIHSYLYPYRPAGRVRRVAALVHHSHVVVASWYGPGFSGRRTSSGERFDPDDLTAASRTLPLGSVARVTNLANGRSVDVCINDRGPNVRGRGIDLSRRAAQEIGLVHKGVGRVRVKPLRRSAVSCSL